MDTAINTDFGVGEDYTQDPAAFQDSLPVPQFLGADRANPWPPHLILDLALGMNEPIEVAEAHNLSPEALARLYENPTFRKELAQVSREVRENGVSFSTRAAALAEDGLTTMYHVLHNPETPASTRLAIFDALAKYGKLTPEKAKEDTTNATQINVNISL